MLAATASASTARDPRAHLDARDVPASPLDLRRVSLGQRGTELVLRITTAAPWGADALGGTSGRSLCVRLHYGRISAPRSSICVDRPRRDDDDSAATLRYTRLDERGKSVGTKRISATIERPSDRSLTATFTPSAVNLNVGRYSWQAESIVPCAAPTVCRDLLPNGGNVIANIRPLNEPSCFGAAARNPSRRCSNPAFRRAVVPEPSEAIIAPNARCTPIQLQTPYACEFGARRVVAESTIALVGDSHAAHWRAALEVVSRARRWRGVSLTRAGCPLTNAVADLQTSERRQACRRWNRAVRRWLAERPAVRTVFVSQHARGRVVAAPDEDAYEVQVQGYIDAWRALPRTVTRIVVIRDTPTSSERSPICVERSLAARRAPGPACALDRERSVVRDPAADAARRLGPGRVRLVDLTRFMCSTRVCFPVVGGALVHKDQTHLTEVFSATLGPFLLRRISAFL